MHPILAHGRRLALYLVFWALFGVLLAALFSIQAGLTRWAAALIALPLSMIYGSVCLSAWYVSRSLPLARTGTIRIGTTALASAVVTSGAWLLIARGWLRVLEWLGALEDAAGRAAGMQALLFGFGVLLYLLSLAVSYLLIAFEQSKEAERRGLEVQVFAREAELRSLRAQIDPHFLFNSLHSISALTTIDPPAARRMCVLLAEFLRESLALGAEARITLGQELRLAARFLDVERVRFGDRLQVAIDAGGADRFLVPPLLLQPIVENAVTHGIAHTVDGGTVRIAASVTPATLRITVENPCDPDRPKGTGAGVGLANVRARLRALHSDGAWASASEADGVWRVEVALPPAEAESSVDQVAAAHE
jgi:two-component system, LytTR family, sensor histidine kinase AlgZ